MKLLHTYARFRKIAILATLMPFQICSFAQSVQKDPDTRLSTRGNGLRCDNVYLSDGAQLIKRITFSYGEDLYVNFDGMEGFERVNGHAFPDMQMLVLDQKGDTTFHLGDLYADHPDGVEQSPLQLHAKLTVADPIHSGEIYDLHVNIQDKKGPGTFHATLEFSVVRDEKIHLSGEQLTAAEIYLFSQQKGHTITNGQAGFNENIYLLFEGLEGFMVQDGQVYLGLSMVVKDAGGNVILDEADLFENSVLSHEDVRVQIAPNFYLTGSFVENPVNLAVRIWDKNSSAWILASTDLLVE